MLFGPQIQDRSSDVTRWKDQVLADDVSLQIYMTEVHTFCPFYMYRYNEYIFVLCHFEENVTQTMYMLIILVETTIKG